MKGRSVVNIFVLILVVLSVTRGIMGGAGDLDLTFAGTGKLRLGTGATSGAVAITSYPGGKYVVAGYGSSGGSDFLLTRYNADGSLDPTFNGNGVALTSILGGTTIAGSVRVQTDGKILVGGGSGEQFALVRYNPDGSLDSSFGGDGVVTTQLGTNSCFGTSMAIVAGNKIVLAGFCVGIDYAVVRYNPDGSLDTSFDGDGIVYKVITGQNAVVSMVPEFNGKIVLAGGTVSFTLLRFNADGSIDNSFDGDGIANADISGSNDTARTVALRSSDFAPAKIVAAGNGGGDFAIARFNLDGSLDTTFDGDGMLTTSMSTGSDSITGLSINTGFPASITVGGTAGGDFGAARYQLSGALDTTFAGTGKAIADFGTGFAEASSMLNQGVVTLAGYYSSPGGTGLALAQFNANGSLNTAFGTGGTKFETGIGGSDIAKSVAVQPDGKIVIASSANSRLGHFGVYRYNADGTPDTGFNGSGSRFLSFGSLFEVLTSMVVQPDGKIVLGGYVITATSNDFALVRLNTDGSLDTSFDGDGMVSTNTNSTDSRLAALALQPDGKIVAAGSAKIGAVQHMAVVRYNSNGSLDTTFESDGIVILTTNLSDSATSVNIQSDNKIVVSGSGFVSSSNDQDFILYRLNPNGLVDTSFDGDGKTSTSIAQDIANTAFIQPDGKIVVAGSSGSSGVENGFTAVRYNTNGSLDTSFDGDGIMTRQIGAAASFCNAGLLQHDGKFFLAGQADNTFAVARFNANGSIDNSYGAAGSARVSFDDNEPNMINAIALDGTGRAVIAGDAGKLLGAARLQSASAARALFDFDGDGKTDVSVYRPSSGLWYLDRSQAGGFVLQLGNATDKIAPADFDGDGKTDIAVYRPSQGVWYLYNSAASTYTTTPFGIAEDLPAPGDYDGDGRADLAIYRPSTGTWWISRTTQGLIAIQFGALGDVPVTGDYDGDGKSDLVVYRPSNGVWYERRSAAGDFAIQFGNSTDKIAPADYDGDGKTDVAVYRPSQTTWYIVNSSNGGYPVFVFGLSTDVPTPGDYDGDGKADVAIFRPSNGQWWLNRTTSGLTVTQFGITGDKPTPNAFGN